MIRCEVIQEFTFSRFNELKDIKRINFNEEGRLYKGDTFICTQDIAEYLTGKNNKGVVVVKVIEVIPLQASNA